MADSTFGSAGVSAREIDLTGPTAIVPVGVPAGVIAASVKGPAFVPYTLPTINDFVVKFGQPVTGFVNGPLAVNEWLRNAQAITFVRVLGVGQAQQRSTDPLNTGRIPTAGFVVGDQQPQGGSSAGALANNNNGVAGGDLGRTYFLGCYMSQSSGSAIFTDAAMPLATAGAATPIIRGVLMAASGVILTLSATNVDSSAPSFTNPANATGTLKGTLTGSVNLTGGKSEFVMLLNGQAGLSGAYSNVITASFDPQAPNYFGRIFNKDPLKMESAGYYLYTQYDIHPAMAVVTGSGIIPAASGASVVADGREKVAFLLTGSQSRNSGSVNAPNYENFEDRYATATSPMVTSQMFGGKPVNLFRVWALDDGAYANAKYKISIENISPSLSDTTKYGTFDLIVRDFNDTDQNKVVIEQWRNLSLDTSSPRFIGVIIGDVHTFFNFDAPQGSQKLQTTGLYANQSKYIRVELTDEVMNGTVDPTALPVGFRGHPHLVTSGTAPMPSFSDTDNLLVTNPFYNLSQMPVPMRLYLTKGLVPAQTVDKTLYWGVQFEQQNSALDANNSTVINNSIESFTKYFPTFQEVWANVITSSNEGTPDTAANGIMDADRFNNNLFSLEKIKVQYNATSGLADAAFLQNWSYVRNGLISTDVVNRYRAWTTNDLTDPSVKQVSKFTFFIQGGFDGVRIFNSDTYYLTNNAVVEEINNQTRNFSNGPTVTSYIQAINLMKDTSEVDVQVLTIPGIRHRYVTDTAIRATEDRFDAIYIMDIEERDVNNNLVIDPAQQLSVTYTATDFRGRGLNSSFAAAYFPDVNLRDSFNRTTVRVPPSVAVLGAYSKNDAVAFPWFAPAGYNRAVLETTNDAVLALSKPNMDALYSVNINPIVAFAGSQGVVVWGQKTVQAKASALDRVNVRRLLIALRRDVKKVANKILFEQNREATLERFSQLVTPIMKRVQDLQGLNNFKVVIDTTTTTQADVENKTIRGKIFLQPTKTLEFLSLDFVLTNRGNFVQG